MKKVSIIMPIYNAEKTLNRAIESVLNQKFTNWELLLLDDGSTDCTSCICHKYEKQDNRIFFFHLAHNGVSEARNYGIEHASGEYIMFFDSDDELHNDTLQDVIMFAEENNEEYVVFFYESVEMESKKIYKKELKNKTFKNKKDFIENLMEETLFQGPCNKLFKKEIIKKYNIKFDTNISLGEDYRFNLDYIFNARRYGICDKILYRYYSSKKGLSLMERNNRFQIKVSNYKYHKQKYIENDISQFDYLYKSFIIMYLSEMSKIVSRKKQNGKIIYEQLKDKDVIEELDEIIKKSNNKGIKIMARLLKKQNYLKVVILGTFLLLVRKFKKM